MIEITKSTLAIQGDGGRPLVTFKPDGTVEFGPDYEPTEAARIAWESLAEYNPLRAELLELLNRIELAESLLRVIAGMGIMYDGDIGTPEWSPRTRGYVVLTPEQDKYLKGLI